MRFMEGIGNSTTQSMLYSSVPYLYGDRAETIIGRMETVAAISQIIAPFIANYIYILGGLYLPYIIISIFLIFTLILV